MSTTHLRRFRPRKLPARTAWIVMPLILSFLMTFLVSGIATVRTIGLSPDASSIWMSSWALSWVVAFPVLLLILPVVRRLVGALVEQA